MHQSAGMELVVPLYSTYVVLLATDINVRPFDWTSKQREIRYDIAAKAAIINDFQLRRLLDVSGTNHVKLKTTNVRRDTKVCITNTH